MSEEFRFAIRCMGSSTKPAHKRKESENGVVDNGLHLMPLTGYTSPNRTAVPGKDVYTWSDDGRCHSSDIQSLNIISVKAAPQASGRVGAWRYACESDRHFSCCWKMHLLPTASFWPPEVCFLFYPQLLIKGVRFRTVKRARGLRAAPERFFFIRVPYMFIVKGVSEDFYIDFYWLFYCICKYVMHNIIINILIVNCKIWISIYKR